MTKASTYKTKGTHFYLFEDNYLQAIKNFNKAIELDPQDYNIWLFRGKCKYFLKQYQEAIKDLNKAIELNPDKEISWYSRGSCKFFLKQYEEAIKDFKKAYQINESILYLGKAKLALKDYKNALVDFKNYLALENNEEVENLIKTCEDQLN
tara:strand:+ start:42 stop:494 length:453 start_codon:yes stop_codon:yes gene_type:complete